MCVIAVGWSLMAVCTVIPAFHSLSPVSRDWVAVFICVERLLCPASVILGYLTLSWSSLHLEGLGIFNLLVMTDPLPAYIMLVFIPLVKISDKDWFLHWPPGVPEELSRCEDIWHYADDWWGWVFLYMLILPIHIWKYLLLHIFTSLYNFSF